MQLQSNAAKRVPLQRGLDQMAERANSQTESIAEWFRTALADARDSLETLSTPEGLRGFIERFVGPSVATRDGRLVKKEAPTLDVGANSTVAATGFEPVTRGL